MSLVQPLLVGLVEPQAALAHERHVAGQGEVRVRVRVRLIGLGLGLGARVKG